MATINWMKSRKPDGTPEWVGIYTKELQNRLRRDLNLEDLLDRAEARKNLDLVGEVTDHWHDARYLPMLKKIEADLSQMIKDLENKHDRDVKAINKKNADQDADITSLKQRCTNLEKRCTNLESRIGVVETNIKNLTTKINNVFDSESRLKFPNNNLLWIG